jgi:deoxyribonuclease-2
VGHLKARELVCVGDINRRSLSGKRGGGTIAFQNPTLWSALSRTSLVLAPPGIAESTPVIFSKKTQHPNAEARPKKNTAPTRQAPPR